MGTLTEEIFSRRVGRQVHADETVVAPVDYAMVHDVTGPLAINAFKKLDKPLWDKDRMIIVFDHVMPANTVAAASLHQELRGFVVEHGVKNLFPDNGICHQVVVEKGFARPGGLIVGADSHSTTYGAMSCFSAGMGSTDIGVVMATGKTWFRVPQTLRIELHGKLANGVYAKDIALQVIRRLGAEGASYMAVEWGGETIATLPMNERFTLANLSVDFGGKAGLIEADEATWSYLGEIGADHEPIRPVNPIYAETLHIDVSDLQPQIACPPSIDNVQDLAEVEGILLDEIFIGSCTNGRLEDLEIVAQFVEGQQLNPRTRTYVVPASKQIYMEALRLGYVKTFMDAGALVLNAGCGPCLGRQHGVLAPGERAMSTSNRNYPGRMGSPEAEIYLASPAVAAASALAGAIADPRKL